MKKNIIILMMLPILIFGQFNTKGYDVSTSAVYKVVDGSKYYFNEGDEVMMIKFNKKAITIQKYDVKKKKETSRKEFPALEKRSYLQYVKELNGNYYIFFSKYDKKKVVESLHYMEINFDAGTIGSAKRLLYVNGRIMYGFSLTSSHNGDKLLVRYRKKPTKKNDKLSTDVIGMNVYNSELDEIWAEEIKMPYTEAEMNNGDYTLDSQGKVYMLIDVYDSDVSRRYIKGEKNYHNEMLVIEEGDLSVHDIDLSDKYTYDNLWLKADANDKLTMAGFFHETIDKKHKDGVYYLSFTEDFEVEVESYNFIPLELVNLYQKERVQKKNNKKKSKNKSVNISNMDLDKIYYQDDGSILLIGEKYYVTSHTYTDSNGNTHTRYVYHYEEILATKISADGELVWMKKLPKIQRGGAVLGGMSYAHTYKDGNHYFFYLDNVKNIDLATNQKPYTHADGKGGIFTVYKIDDDNGDVSKNSLFDMKEVTVQGKNKPLKVYQFNVDRVMETENGIAVEVYKKGKEDLMIQIEID